MSIPTHCPVTVFKSVKDSYGKTFLELETIIDQLGYEAVDFRHPKYEEPYLNPIAFRIAHASNDHPDSGDPYIIVKKKESLFVTDVVNSNNIGKFFSIIQDTDEYEVFIVRDENNQAKAYGRDGDLYGIDNASHSGIPIYSFKEIEGFSDKQA